MQLFGKDEVSCTLLLTMLLLILPVAGCTDRYTSTGRPSVLLISIDTLRPDHLSAYGYKHQTTPVLEKLAADGVLFENAVSTSNWTLPAHMSLLTGLYPSIHGVEDQETGLASELHSLPELFYNQGYRTAGFASHTYVGDRYGFDRGFEQYDMVVDQPAEEVTRKALEWLDLLGGEPFFLFLHYFDPHWDYRPPQPYDGIFGPTQPEHGKLNHLYRYFDRNVEMPAEVARDVIALYDGEIRYTDEQIGRVLERLGERGRLDDTIVVVTSDHGEEFGEHGTYGHGTHLHGEVTRVPLLIRYPPRIAGGSTESGLATIVDIPATLLSLAGFSRDEQFGLHGQDLLTAIESPDDDPSREVILESTRWGPKRFAVRSAHYKLLGGGYYIPLSFDVVDGQFKRKFLPPVPFMPQLYAVREDPQESENLTAREEHRQQAEQLQKTLKEYISHNVGGLWLTCSARQRGPWYTGAIGLDIELDDEPVADFPGPWADVAAPSATRFHVRLQPGPDGYSIIFPLDDAAGQANVSLARDAEGIFNGSVTLPAPGEEVALGEWTEQIGGCRLSTRRGAALYSAAPEVELSEAELEKLRALGYLQ